MLEYSLIHAIANGQAWLCGPDKLQRLVEIVTTERKQEVEGIFKEWQNGQFFLNMNWWPTGELDYTVAYFSGHGMEDLKEKLVQFPPGTHFASVMTVAQRNRHRAEVTEVENTATGSGMHLDIQTPR